jgi:UDP:flavonoid glycosyltransferase YjiC (YdhE family)
MRILFTTIPGTGHFNPVVPTAKALQARGHEVTFAASEAFTPSIETAGFKNIPAGPSWLENMGDPVMQEILRKEFFTELVRMGMVDGIVRAAHSVRAELIIGEAAETGAPVAAAILDLPYARHAPAAAKIWWPMMRDGLARAAAEHGLDGQRLIADDYPIVDIDRTPPSMETPGHVPTAHTFNIRPELYDGAGEMPDWADELGKARPLVYVTLGTVFNGNLPLFQLVAESLGGEDVDVLMTLGRGIPRDALGELPDNIRVAGYVPQSELVRRASAMVCHGGYNSVISALTAGVPLYVIPMAADQPYNAERVLAAGAGLSARVPEGPPPGPPQAGPPAFTPPTGGQIRDSVRRLLTEPHFATGAQRVAAEIAAMPPVVHAAERLEEAMGERAAVTA